MCQPCAAKQPSVLERRSLRRSLDSLGDDPYAEPTTEIDGRTDDRGRFGRLGHRGHERGVDFDLVDLDPGQEGE